MKLSGCWLLIDGWLVGGLEEVKAGRRLSRRRVNLHMQPSEHLFSCDVTVW